jgi:hypothetical protein
VGEPDGNVEPDGSTDGCASRRSGRTCSVLRREAPCGRGLQDGELPGVLRSRHQRWQTRTCMTRPQPCLTIGHGSGCLRWRTVPRQLDAQARARATTISGARGAQVDRAPPRVAAGGNRGPRTKAREGRLPCRKSPCAISSHGRSPAGRKAVRASLGGSPDAHAADATVAEPPCALTVALESVMCNRLRGHLLLTAARAPASKSSEYSVGVTPPV